MLGAHARFQFPVLELAQHGWPGRQANFGEAQDFPAVGWDIGERIADRVGHYDGANSSTPSIVGERQMISCGWGFDVWT